MRLHSGCDLIEIIDHKKLLERTDNLVKSIELIKKHTQLFNISQHITDHEEELELFTTKVTKFEEKVMKTIQSQKYKKYLRLKEKARKIKGEINSSMMYKNYCIFMQSLQQNDKELSIQDQLLEAEKREAMKKFNELHDKIHTEMIEK